MALLAKIGIPALVVIGLITGTWYMKHQGGEMKADDATSAYQGTLQKKDPASSQSASQASAISSRDSSDDSLNKDEASIDAEMKTMDTNNSEVDQADKPVSQDSL